MIDRLRAARLHRVHLLLMLALTFSTGVIDAVGFLGLDQVFTGNMTGNVVVLGMGVAGSEGLPVMGPLLALVGFMLGAVLTGRAMRTAGPGWTTRTTTLFGTVGVGMAAVGVSLMFADEMNQTQTVATTTVLGALMGMQGATARFLAVADVTTVVVTSTVIGLASDTGLGMADRRRQQRRVAAVALIVAGAAVGGLLLQWHLWAGVLLSATIILVVTTIGHVTRPHHR